jgi:AcrR family transcriptional regulator
MPRLAQPLAPLPTGRHGLPRQFVAHNQRERLLIAMVEAVAEKGYSAVTVADVVAGSGVSRRTFYELFDNKEDCFLGAYEELVGRMVVAVDTAYRAQESWQARVVAALGALLDFFAAEPEAAQIGLVEVLAAGPEALERFRNAQRGFYLYLDETRKQAAGPTAVSEHTAIAAIGAMIAVVTDIVYAGRTRDLPEVRDELARLGLAVFIGPVEADRAVTKGAAEIAERERAIATSAEGA